QRVRCCRSMSVTIDRRDDLSGRDAELVSRPVDYPFVRLVRNEPIDIVGGVAGQLEGVLDDIGDHRHRMPEYLSAFHAQMADRAGGGGTAVHIEFRFMAAGGAQPDRERTPGIA